MSIFVLVLALNAAASPLSLREAIEMATESSPEVVGAGGDVIVEGGKVHEAIGALLPRVDAFSSLDRNYRHPEELAPQYPGYDWKNGLQASWTLYDPTLHRGLELARIGRRLQEIGLSRRLDDAAILAASSYGDLVLLRKQERLCREAIANLDSMASGVRRKVALGLLPEIDLDRIANQQNALEVRMEGIRGGIASGTARLAGILGLDRGDTIEIADTALPGKLDEGIASQMGSEDSMSAALGLEAERISRKMDGAIFHPVVALTWQGYWEGATEEFGRYEHRSTWYPIGVVGLSVTVPLFEGLQPTARRAIHDAAIESGSHRMRKDAAARERELDAAIRCASFAEESRERQQRIAASSGRIADVLERQYVDGLVPVSDALQSRNDAVAAMIDLGAVEVAAFKAKLEVCKYNKEVQTCLLK